MQEAGQFATTAKESGMSILRNIGNRLRRGDEGAEGAPPAQSFAGKPPTERAPPPVHDESPDLYYEDNALGHSIHGLEEVRLSLRTLTAAANSQKDMLMSCATTERALGAHLVDMMHPGGAPSGASDDDDDGVFEREPSMRASRHFSRFLRTEDVEAQKVLGKGLTSHSESTVKLATAMSNPINELERSFEERFSRKIVPLRRRYVDQKGQYLKYKRNADVADSDEKRSYFEALAEAAKPVWMRTSTELRTESDVMTELTARNMAKWSRSLALQHERALAIAAANFADAFQRAKANNKQGPNGR